MKRTSPHPDAHMLVDPVDHEAATTRATRYFDDFDKVAQHSKSDVNLMRAYLDLREKMTRLANQEIGKILADNPLIKAMENTVPRPEMDGAKEGVDIKVDFSCTHGGEDEPTPSFRFADVNSGAMIMDVRMDYKSFGQLMTGLGHRPAKARIFDTFKVIGLYCEHKTRLVTRPKECDRGKRYDEIHKIIAKECSTFLSDGWFISSDGTGTQQHDQKGWKIILARYVKTKPESKGEE